MESPPVSHSNGQELLPKKLRFALWRRVDRCLQRGEVLITTEHFQEVMEREFRKLIHIPPSARVRAAIREMVAAVNEEHPETFLSLGIKNAVTRYFRDMAKRAGSKNPEVLAESRQRIKQMVREGRTAFFLESIGVEVGSKGVPARVERAIEKIVSGEKLKAESQFERRSQHRRRPVGLAPVNLSATVEDDQEEGAAQIDLPDEKERQERTEKVRAYEKRLIDEEMKKAPLHLDAFVEQNLLEEKEVLTLRQLYGIDERLASGEIDQEEAERLRGEIDAAIRSKLEERLRAAVDHAAHYLNAFESLKRIPSSRDGALRFLIRHKDLVMSEDDGTDMTPVIEELDADSETLDSLNRIMERREHEARMISANLPPYRYVSGQGKIANLVIGEEFVEELRNLDRDALSERLNSAESEVRIKPAADIRCMVALIARSIETTPFSRTVRLLEIKHTIAQLYRSSAEGKSGRHKVQHFVKQRLIRLYPNISPAERAGIEKASQEIMAAIDREREGGDQKEELRYYRA